MHPLYSIPNFVTCALIVSLGIFVVLKRPQEKINQLFGLLSWSVAHWLLGYAFAYCTTDPRKALAFARFAYVGVVFIPTFFLHFMCEFLKIRSRVTLLFAYGISIIFLYVIQQDYFMNGVRLFYWGYYPKAGPWYWPWMIYFYAGFMACDYQFTKAYFVQKRISKDSLRAKQLKYVLWANCVASVSVMDYFPKYGVSIYPCAYLAALGWMIFMAYAIVKFRLMDVRLVIRKTLIYSFVSALLTAVYFAVVTMLTHLSSGMVGKFSWISMAAAGIVVTLIFMPVFRWVQTLIDRLFFRFRIDREAKLMEFSSEIIQQEDTERLTQSLCQTLEDSLHPKGLGLYLQAQGAGDYLEVSGRIPSAWKKVLPSVNLWTTHFRQDPEPLLWNAQSKAWASGDVFNEMSRLEIHAALPLASRTEILGFLLLGEKRSEEVYTNDDLILMRIIANQATVAYERPKLLREVSSGFVHEVKMPLSKISLPAELTFLEIEQALKSGGDVHDLLPKIQRRMKYIMDQAFLAGHRIDALQQLRSLDSPRREVVSVRSVVQTSITALSETFQQTNAVVHLRLPGDLPAIHGDPRQLEIVFVNLMKNAAEAIEALKPDRVREIFIAGHVEGSKVVVEIADTGQGIRPEDRERIFQPHFTTKGSHGAGMGLFLCRQIVQAHDGTMRARNTAMGGASFIVTLPSAA